MATGDGQAVDAKRQLEKFGHTPIARRRMFYDRNFGMQIPVCERFGLLG